MPLAGAPHLITGFKQRLLTHLFHVAVQRGREAAGSSSSRQQRQQCKQLELQHFYRAFDDLNDLVIWRVSGRQQAEARLLHRIMV